MKTRAYIVGTMCLALAARLFGAGAQPKLPNSQRIRPWSKNPWRWAYKGKPVLLLGGSKDDNLFQIPDLVGHLDEMQAVGANYIRNTMSDRRDKGFEVYPFKRLANGKYDLNRWNPEYWRRVDRLLEETFRRDIIVQIELWDRFDYSRDHWETHPYNPKNNINYTYAESGFAPHYPRHPGANDQPFFFTTPRQRNNKVVFPYQKRFVDELLRRALLYPNVLYCIDNETSGAEAWGAFWADYIHRRAKELGLDAFVTEMWDDWNLRSAQHRRTFDHPEHYDFADVSQNNHQKGQTHWDNFQWVRRYLAKRPRPINTVKTYGADTGRYGTSRDGVERWWRHLIGGAAAARFHRPASGLGLSKLAKASIRAARLVERRVRLWDVEPAMSLLRGREPNEAYLAARPGKAYVAYFTDGGKVELDLRALRGKGRIQWVSIDRGALGPDAMCEGGRWIPLSPPGKGQWAATIVAE